MGSSRVRMVRCPRCGEGVQWLPSSEYRPFCSARCKLGDLGAWANDEYRIPSETPPEIGEIDERGMQ
jgi:uncharacterized protein